MDIIFHIFTDHSGILTSINSLCRFNVSSPHSSLTISCKSTKHKYQSHLRCKATPDPFDTHFRSHENKHWYRRYRTTILLPNHHWHFFTENIGRSTLTQQTLLLYSRVTPQRINFYRTTRPQPATLHPVFAAKSDDSAQNRPPASTCQKTSLSHNQAKSASHFSHHSQRPLIALRYITLISSCPAARSISPDHRMSNRITSLITRSVRYDFSDTYHM